ncbi:MAG: C39 family peptidase [Sedimentisphaerales bacterium]|nr:C39 family peptidase [Sedimentisphaerales bacterium]
MPNSGFARELTRDLTRSFVPLSLLAFLLVQGCGSLPTSTDEPSFQRRYGDFQYCAVEVVRQSRHYTCGPACLSSVLAYWDVDISEAQIVRKYPSRERRPYFLLGLRAIAEAEERKAYVISMDTQSRSEVEEQISKGRPLICAVRLPRSLHLFDGVPILVATCQALAWALEPRKDHFVVVVGLKPQEVLVMDPAHGFAALPWRRFEGAWSRMKHACLLVSGD